MPTQSHYCSRSGCNVQLLPADKQVLYGSEVIDRQGLARATPTNSCHDYTDLKPGVCNYRGFNSAQCIFADLLVPLQPIKRVHRRANSLRFRTEFATVSVSA